LKEGGTGGAQKRRTDASRKSVLLILLKWAGTTYKWGATRNHHNEGRERCKELRGKGSFSVGGRKKSVFIKGLRLKKKGAR